MLSRSAASQLRHHLDANDWRGRSRVAVAVSGGGDSLALLFLLHDHIRHLADSPHLLALTVDHGLRAESAPEAKDVGILCARHGIAHETLRWEGPKPRSGLSAAAREARHALLARKAAEAGAELVLTGHTLDDQAETVMMRGRRASGDGSARGMAGIAPATLYDGRIWFTRPLLGARRETLRAFLRARGVEWADDPTNEDMRYERARIRAGIDDAQRLEAARMAADAADRRIALGGQAADLIDRLARLESPGLIAVSGELLTCREEAVIYALRILLSLVGGSPHLPDHGRTAVLVNKLGTPGFRTTLARAVVETDGSTIRLHRERRSLPAIALRGEAVQWDGRYRLLPCAADRHLTVAPFTDENARAALAAEDGRMSAAGRAALAAEPALWRGATCLGRACSDGPMRCERLLAPWARYLPLFDLAPARAAARLLGAPHPPSSPLASH